ncbi:3'-to-5' exoribonuclease RNase R [hydrothermal vent metagenome]|uniref:exoribonuclease II n=1 Tax=hydrothermal vent metagenome TaxID=652676 RepID=A0A3B0RXC1_9ZZZZ
MAKQPKNTKNKKLSKKKKNKKSAFKLPSEEDIQKFAASMDGLIGKEAIARHFKLKNDQRAGLKGLLKRMRDNGKLAPLPEKKPTFASGPTKLKPTAVLRVTGLDKDGEVKLEPANWDVKQQGEPPEIFLHEAPKQGGRRSIGQPPAQGDLILARLTPVKGSSNTYNARTLKRLEDNREALLGVIRQSGDSLRVVPTEKKSRFDYEVSRNQSLQAKPGDLVRFDLQSGRPGSFRRAKVLERLGNIDDFQNISLIALTEQGIPVEMPEDVAAQAAAFKPFKPVKNGDHKDMRQVPLITIDPPDAKDHDDAVWAERDDDAQNPGGVKIIVAIADVAYYVRAQTRLDEEAQKRGNSTYLPDRVVPMLPEKLSNELCSLKDGVDRPALACFMTFDKKGKKLHHHFDRIVMKSAAKLSYREAQDAIDGKPGDVAGPLLEGVLKPLWAAYEILKKGRDKRQPLNLELPERKLIFNKHGLMSDVIIADRFDAHKLVEEFMIQANVAAAESLEKHKVPVIYRIHDAPAPEKLIALADFLKTLDLTGPKGQVVKPANFNSILAKVAGGEYEHVVNQVVLRSQSQAVYTTENLGHFGLNLRRYAHFTSPIRRYADLTVHRGLIRAYNLGKDGLSGGEVAQLEEIAQEISKTERRSMVAERDTKDRMIAGFLAEKIDSTFSGRIGGIAGAGLFITLEGTGADGFIPVSTLEGDYFIHDEPGMAMVGERTGETYKIGDKVTVKLVKATPVSGGMQMEMISKGKPGKPMQRKKRRFSRSSGPRRR